MKRTLFLALALGLLWPPLEVFAAARPGARPKGKARARPKGKARKGAPAEEQAEGETGQAYVLEDSDAVILRDGTRIKGTVLCAGAAAVTILIKDEDGKPQEKTIPREKIERVIKNADAGFPKKFATKKLDGHKYLVEAEPEDMGDPENLLDDGGGGAPRPRPRPRPRSKAPAKGRTPKRPAAGGKRPARPKLPGGLKLPPGFKLPPGVKLPPGFRLPKNIDPGRLKAIIDRLQKRGMLDKVDPKLRKAIGDAMKKMK